MTMTQTQLRAGKWKCIFLLASTVLSCVHAAREPTQQQQGNASRGGQPGTPSFLSRVTSMLTLRSLRGSISPTSEFDTIQTAKFYGYGAELHEVTTEDGYILGIHRIYDELVSQGAPKQVVVVNHAFLFSSREFLTLGPGKSLGYILADAGYDVWLCNARGNTHSRKHTTLSPDSKEFWDFSYTEQGMYDVPAVIDYALKVTGTSQVHYIGLSIGTINFLVMGSKRPDILPKVKSYTALAPLTRARGRSVILQSIMKNYQVIATASESMGAYEILASNKWLTAAGKTFCNNGWYTQALCAAFLYALCGDNKHQVDNSIMQEMWAHFPAGSSLKTFRHFGQNYFNGFREYDYGALQNTAKYNSTEPPMFDYSTINVPSQIYFGLNDLMAPSDGAVEICHNLPHTFRCEAVPDPKFSHLDFIWAENAHTLVYPRVLDGLKFVERRSTDNNSS